jgi:tetratricopeptide (TPR) repeat protein
LIWIIFLFASLLTLRNMIYFAVTAYFVFLANLQYLSLEGFLPPKWNNEKFKDISAAVLKAALIIWIIGYGQQLMLRGYYDFDKFERKNEFGGLSQRNFPRKAVDFLVDTRIKGNFFNDFNSGAYLVGRVSPNIKVFIDGRTEVYGASFYKNYTKIWKGDAALFEEAEEAYHLTGAFLNSVYVPAPEKLIRYLYDRQDWILVYFDYDAAIFLKDIPANRAWIDRWRIDLRQWQTLEAPLLNIGTYKVEPYRYINRAYALYNMGFPQSAEKESIEALRIQPYNTKAYKLLGKIYNDRGEYKRGFEALRKAKLVDPQDMNIRYQIALALYHLGELEKSEEQCQRVLSRRPMDEKAQELMALIHAAKRESQVK